MEKYYQVRFNDGVRLDCKVAADLTVAIGEFVLVTHDRVVDIGVITSLLGEGSVTVNPATLPEITELAKDEDYKKMLQNRADEERLVRVCEEEIALNDLTMEVVKAHATLDRSLTYFFFTSEGRVDFRNLVKCLARRLSSRIELRQIGVRDECALIGGIANCGRNFCCCTYLNSFETINVKIAKDQGLPLNPLAISGACGRLKCCLKYEHDGYVNMQDDLPRLGSMYATEQGNGKIIDVNFLNRRIKVRLFDESEKMIEVDLNKTEEVKRSCNKHCNDCSKPCKTRKSQSNFQKK